MKLSFWIATMLLLAVSTLCFGQDKKNPIHIFTTNPVSLDGTGVVVAYKDNRICRHMLKKMRNMPSETLREKKRQNEYYTNKFRRVCLEKNAASIVKGFKSLKSSIRNKLRKKKIKAKIDEYQTVDQLDYNDSPYANKLMEILETQKSIIKNVKEIDFRKKMKGNEGGSGLPQASLDPDSDLDPDADSDDSGAGGVRIVENLEINTEDSLRSNFEVLHGQITHESDGNEGRLVRFAEKGKNKEAELIAPGPRISNIFSHYYQIQPPQKGTNSETIYFRLFMYDLAQVDSNGRHPLYFKKTPVGYWEPSAAGYLQVMQKEFSYIIDQFTVQ